MFHTNKNFHNVNLICNRKFFVQKKEYYYLEFGVFQGKSANYFSKFVNKIYCFDSFEGLKEDWLGTSEFVGSMSLDKKIPKLNTNVEPIVGWVEDTLDGG